jgi:hypothetical protein
MKKSELDVDISESSEYCSLFECSIYQTALIVASKLRGRVSVEHGRRGEEIERDCVFKDFILRIMRSL